MTSVGPGWLYANTGVPQAILSNITMPNVSVLDGNTKASALA